MIPCNIGWDDVGSWLSFDRVCPYIKDAQNNNIKGNVVCIDAANNIVLSEDRLVALIGVKDLVVSVVMVQF